MPRRAPDLNRAAGPQGAAAYADDGPAARPEPARKTFETTHQRMTTFVDRDVLARLEAHLEATGERKAHVVTKAIDEYLNRHKTK